MNTVHAALRISRAPVRVLGLLLVLMLCRHGVAAEPTKEKAWKWIDAHTEQFQQANQHIWSFAETGLTETRSSLELQNLLSSYGFSVAVGVAGMPTAFVASYGSGKPVIGILAEFDALPGLSQAAVPNPKPGPNPAAGHACGHSIFGVGSTAAALAVKQIIESGAIKGTIKLYGTPAEETGIGKVYMLRDGYFKDDDVILNWHAYERTEATYSDTKALANVKFRFSGTAAHASAYPYDGHSALDAVELLNIGVNFMREHVKTDARIHYVITDGGGQPNVVPASAEVWYYVRANTFADVHTYFNWIKDIAEGAAKMSRTRLEKITVQSEMHQMIPLRTLAAAVHRNLKAVGAPAWSADELKFARTTQTEFGRSSEIALSVGVQPVPAQPDAALASTDTAEISWFVPTGGLRVASYGYGLPLHSWPVVAATGTSIGTKALVVAAKGLAGTAIDLYTDPKLLAAVKADFKATRGDAPWLTLIPEGQTAPKQIR